MVQLHSSAVLEMPIEMRVVVKIDVHTFGAGAVKITRQRCQNALEVRRATGGVVPFIANFFAGGFERIAIAIECARKRHAGVDPVVERALDHIGEA